MLVLLGILGYAVIGYLAILAAVLIHVISAEKDGYEALKYWMDNLNVVNEAKCIVKNDTLRLIYGLMIWPVRLVEFWSSIPSLYEQYDLKY